MAEIRKHNPTTSAIGDAVRAAAGETIRPVPPGGAEPSEPVDEFDPYTSAPVADEEPAPTTTAGGAPTIGSIPDGLFLSPKPKAD